MFVNGGHVTFDCVGQNCGTHDCETTQEEGNITEQNVINERKVVSQVAAYKFIVFYKAEEMIEPSAAGSSSLRINGSGESLLRRISQIIPSRVSDG